MSLCFYWYVLVIVLCYHTVWLLCNFSQILFSQDWCCSSIKQEGVFDCPRDNTHILHNDGRELGCEIAFSSSPLCPTFPKPLPSLHYQDKALRAQQVDFYVPHVIFGPVCCCHRTPAELRWSRTRASSHVLALASPRLFVAKPQARVSGGAPLTRVRGRMRPCLPSSYVVSHRLIIFKN